MSRKGSSYDTWHLFSWRQNETKGEQLAPPIEIHETETGWWIFQGGECIGRLTWDEMLGSVAAMTIQNGGPRRRLYPGQWKNYHTALPVRASGEAAP